MIKYAEDIVKEIDERGAIKIPDNCVTGKDRCDCETMNKVVIRSEVIGYGRSMCVSLDFINKAITTWYDHSCDNGTLKKLDIKFCPLCGRLL